MKRVLILMVFISFISKALAQKESAVWYFGDKAGLDFNSGAPQVLEDGELSTVEGCASIATSEGDLQFYTDGITIRNRNHEFMPNGKELKGHPSSTQSAIIIPTGENSNVYYVFTTDFQTRGGLYYSKVDMNLEGGLGDVTTKNVLLKETVTEKLTAVKHANGVDVWVVAHDWGNEDYLVYLVTANGVVETPVVSSVGFNLDYATQGDDVFKSRGYLKASVDGSMLGVCHSFVGVEVLDFNTTTGVVSNPKIIMEGSDKDFYGLEFSPYGNVLYVSVINQDIYQFNLMERYPELSMVPLEVPKKTAGALQIAIDGKIYVASKGVLSRIEHPEVIGAGCVFTLNAINLGTGESEFGLPSFITSSFELGILADNFCFGDTTSFSFEATEPIDSVVWDFGDGNTSTAINPTNNYLTPGEYIVTATVQIGTIIRMNSRNIRIYESPNAFDVSFFRCEEDNVFDVPINLSLLDSDVLNSQNDLFFEVSYFRTIQDATGNTNAVDKENYKSVSMEETLFTRVQNIDSKTCYALAEVLIQTIEKPLPQLEKVYEMCPFKNDLVLDGGDFSSWSWQNEGGEILGENRDFDVNSIGNYSLTVEKEKAGITCENTILFRVVPPNLIEDFETSVSSFTDDITIRVDAIGDGEYKYSLNGVDFQTDDTFSVLPGKYTVYVGDIESCSVISKEVIALGYQKFFTPNGDAINDYWNIVGSEHFPSSTVFVFDQYGKLLKQINPNDIGWDGTYLNSRMPSSDYWFRFENEDGFVFKGHFTLKR